MTADSRPPTLLETAPAPHPRLVELLEQLLEHAKAGELVGFASAYIWRAGTPSCTWCAMSDGARGHADLIAELGRLHLELMLADGGFRAELRELLNKE